MGLDGSFLLPTYNESLKSLGHDHEYSLIFKSKKIEVGTQPWPSSAMNSTAFLVQPPIVRPVEGKLSSSPPAPGKLLPRAYFRDRRAKWIYTATSEDDGQTWSEPTATGLPNNAGIHVISDAR
jgi:hypothetical protein